MKDKARLVQQLKTVLLFMWLMLPVRLPTQSRGNPIHLDAKQPIEARVEDLMNRMTLKARVKAGRLVVDEPTDLPEGTEIELLPLDPGDWLDDEGRAALHKALQDSEEDVKAGRLADADAVLRELRSR